MQLGVAPRAAQLVRCHGDRGKGAAWLGLEEAEALGEFARNEVAQRDVVDQHDETDLRRRRLRARAHRHVAGNHGDFPLQVDAPALVGKLDGIARAQKGVRAALVHQRIAPEARRHLGAAGAAHQFHVVDIGRAVGPLVGSRQRRRAGAFVE